MSLAPVIGLSDLELTMGVRTVAEYLCDDGSRKPDPVIVSDVLQQATDRGAGALRSAFSPSEIVEMVATDTAVRGAFRSIAAGYAGARRPQIRDDRGRTMWFDERTQAVAYLEEIAEAHKRSIAEGVGSVPDNPLTQPLTNYSPGKPRFEFARLAGETERRGGGF